MSDYIAIWNQWLAGESTQPWSCAFDGLAHEPEPLLGVPVQGELNIWCDRGQPQFGYVEKGINLLHVVAMNRFLADLATNDLARRAAGYR